MLVADGEGRVKFLPGRRGPLHALYWRYGAGGALPPATPTVKTIDTGAKTIRHITHRMTMAESKPMNQAFESSQPL